MTKLGVDIEKFGQSMSEELLAEVALSKRSKEEAHAALKEIARRRGPRRYEVFREVLDDAGQDASTKATAAVALGTEPAAESRELLQRHLAEKDATVFRRVVQSLGRIGDERTLELLERAQAPDDGPARRAHAFAKSLISYRMRLNRNRLETPAEKDLLKVDGGIEFKVAEAEPARLRKAMEDARRDLPAVPLATEGALELDCRGVKMFLLFTDDFWRPEVQQTLRERDALFMVLLKYTHSPGRHFLENYFFSHPLKGREEVTVLGTRPGGVLTYAGRVDILPDGLRLAIKSVASRYAPAIDVAGVYTKGRWKVERAITGTTVSAGKAALRRPRPAPRPSRLSRG